MVEHRVRAQFQKARPNSWTEGYQETRFEHTGRNVVMSSSIVDKVPVYRAESDANLSKKLSAQYNGQKIKETEEELTNAKKCQDLIKNIDETYDVLESMLGEEVVPLMLGSFLEKSASEHIANLKHLNETKLFVNIGGDYKRTEDFALQAQIRETKYEMKTARVLRKLINMPPEQRTNEYVRATLNKLLQSQKDETKNQPLNTRKGLASEKLLEDLLAQENEDLTKTSLLKEAIKKCNELRFNANGQTIRSSYISQDLAREIQMKASPEHPKDVDTLKNDRYLALSLSSEAINVDVTKSHNQFGICGNTLHKFRKQVAENGIKEGFIYDERSRSCPPAPRSYNSKLSSPESKDKISNSKSKSWVEKISDEGRNKFAGSTR